MPTELLGALLMRLSEWDARAAEAGGLTLREQQARAYDVAGLVQAFAQLDRPMSADEFAAWIDEAMA